MQKVLLLIALLISTVASYRLGSVTSRPLISSSSVRSTMNRLPNMILQSSPSTTDNEIVAEPSKMEQMEPVVEAVVETKKEEWRDPVAVAAEGKGPLDDLFPGGLSRWHK